MPLKELAERRNLLHRKSDVPIPGTKHIEYMKENAGASGIELSEDTVTKLNALINEDTITGNRYVDDRMAEADAERD